MNYKIVGTLCLVLMAYLCQAQTEKGNWMLGGDIGLGLGAGGNFFTYSGQMNPNLGYFVKDNLALGLKTRVNIAGRRDQFSQTYTFSPFARYYFDTKKEKIKPFVQGELGYEYFNLKRTGFTFPDHRLKSSLSTGLAFFLSENVSLETSVRYDYRNGLDGSIPAHDIGFNLGFQIHLNGKKNKKE